MTFTNKNILQEIDYNIYYNTISEWMHDYNRKELSEFIKIYKDKILDLQIDISSYKNLVTSYALKLYLISLIEYLSKESLENYKNVKSEKYILDGISYESIMYEDDTWFAETQYKNCIPEFLNHGLVVDKLEYAL